MGRGKLAQAIARQCKKEHVTYSSWEKKQIRSNTVVVYCGSVRLWESVRAFCTDMNVPLLLLSTNVPIPKRTRFPFLYAPNTSREVRDFIETVDVFAQKTHYDSVSILESHQRAKKDISGTARLIAHKLGKSEAIITSVRSAGKQLKLGIPKRYLDGHAYHRVSFVHNSVTTEFSVLVFGRETYARGAIEIAGKLIENKNI